MSMIIAQSRSLCKSLRLYTESSIREKFIPRFKSLGYSFTLRNKKLEKFKINPIITKHFDTGAIEELIEKQPQSVDVVLLFKDNSNSPDFKELKPYMDLAVKLSKIHSSIYIEPSRDYGKLDPNRLNVTSDKKSGHLNSIRLNSTPDRRLNLYNIPPEKISSGIFLNDSSKRKKKIFIFPYERSKILKRKNFKQYNEEEMEKLAKFLSKLLQ